MVIANVRFIEVGENSVSKKWQKIPIDKSFPLSYLCIYNHQNTEAMKAKILHLATSILIFGIFISYSGYSQAWGGTQINGLLTNWTVNINAGFTSYFGDLSLHDLNIGAKLEKESGSAFGLIITKNIFRDAIGLSGQLIAGNLQGRKDEISFSAKLLEYNLHARIDFVDLWMLRKNHAMGVVGFAGIGQFIFETKKVESNEGFDLTYDHASRVPEFVFFFGGGVYYKLNSNIGITADLALRQCQNDRLDDYVKNDDFDYYSYLSVGVSYYINSIKRAPLKNKARIANSSFMFDSPAR